MKNKWRLECFVKNGEEKKNIKRMFSGRLHFSNLPSARGAVGQMNEWCMHRKK